MKKMTRLTWVFVLSMIITSFAQTNFYQQVSSMWFSGDKRGVLDIANQRLAQNSNDIAGLLLKLEYETEFLQLDNMTNTMAKIISVGSTFSGTNFSKVFPVIEASYEIMKQVVTNYPPAEYASDLTKTNVTGKTMSCDAEIKALQDDGYFH
jgi:hypothetical protein